jgi:hypothetical protein
LERSAIIRHDGASDHGKVDTEEAFHSKNQCGARPVSESFENGLRTPLLGIEKYFDNYIGQLKLANVQAWATPTSASAR